MANSSLAKNLTSILMSLVNETKINYAYAVNNNNNQVKRQFMQAFTAPQMFIPSMSTRASFGDFGGQLPPPLFPPHSKEEHEITFRDHWITYLVPMILQVICSGLCYYTDRLACKLCMQRLGFALRLTHVTLITLSVAVDYMQVGS